jgi:thiamine monophosphate kinase
LNYKVAAFISGFRSLANNFSLKPVSGDINKADGRIVVNIQSNANSGI